MDRIAIGGGDVAQTVLNYYLEKHCERSTTIVLRRGGISDLAPCCVVLVVELSRGIINIVGRVVQRCLCLRVMQAAKLGDTARAHATDVVDGTALGKAVSLREGCGSSKSEGDHEKS